jgi:hypothetical protein
LERALNERKEIGQQECINAVDGLESVWRNGEEGLGGRKRKTCHVKET